jgi:hypothetical protein
MAKNPDWAIAMLSCLALSDNVIACFELDCRGRRDFTDSKETSVFFEIAEVKVHDIAKARAQLTNALSMMFLTWDIVANKAFYANQLVSSLKSKRPPTWDADVKAHFLGFGYIYHWPTNAHENAALGASTKILSPFAHCIRLTTCVMK